jgi:hypothetical protein
MNKLQSYSIAFDFTDITEVEAYSKDEALELAQTVFSESGYDDLRGELNILDVYEPVKE